MSYPTCYFYLSYQKKRFSTSRLTVMFLKFDSYGRHMIGVHALAKTVNIEVILRGLRILLWSLILHAEDYKIFCFPFIIWLLHFLGKTTTIRQYLSSHWFRISKGECKPTMKCYLIFPSSCHLAKLSTQVTCHKHLR